MTILSALEVAPNVDRRIQEGRQWEEDFFGFSLAFNPRKIQRGSERVAFHESIITVMQLQESLSWDPRRPKTWQSRKLHEAVKYNLPKNLRGEILLDCALGTTLDYMFGVDGFFVLESNPMGPVTFNLVRTCCWRQLRKLKANGLISRDILERDNDRIHSIGWKISRSLIRALSKKTGKSSRRRLW